MLKTLLTTAALASLFLAGAAAAQTPLRNAAGDYTTGPITTDQAWENGVYTYNEFRHSRYFDHYNTIPYKKGDQAEWLEFSEFRKVIEEDFRSADRNSNGRIDNETERCLFHRTAEGRLTRAEADALNRGRHCQLDGDRNGSLTEAEFLAVSLADFDRADRNKDGVLSGRQEIGALASIGGEAQAGLTRAQACDLAKLRFAVLDRQPRDGVVTLDEYLAVTAEEFARSDANNDGALTGPEARRQAQ